MLRPRRRSPDGHRCERGARTVEPHPSARGAAPHRRGGGRSRGSRPRGGPPRARGHGSGGGHHQCRQPRHGGSASHRVRGAGARCARVLPGGVRRGRSRPRRGARRGARHPRGHHPPDPGRLLRPRTGRHRPAPRLVPYVLQPDRVDRSGSTRPAARGARTRGGGHAPRCRDPGTGPHRRARRGLPLHEAGIRTHGSARGRDGDPRVPGRPRPRVPRPAPAHLRPREPERVGADGQRAGDRDRTDAAGRVSCRGGEVGRRDDGEGRHGGRW